MKRTRIHTDAAPAAIGPYSQAIVAGDMVYCSGQVGVDPESRQFELDTIQGQTQQALKNLSTVLTAAGSGLAQVIKTTVFLSDMENFAEMNAVYATFFGEEPPARSTVAVKDLPLGALVEIEAIALRSA
jgi:2-iminobutanoate/2-iminopropanoate deaminase